MDKQVDKKAYKFTRYCDQDRWSSYWHQINEIIKCNPNNLLEVGVGDRVVSSYLKNNAGIEYKSLDIAEDLNPDIIGSVDNIPISDNSYDVVCAFEVLEHLPFDKFNICLKELKRISKKHAIISLPHWGRHFSLAIRLPFFKKINFQYKFNLFSIRHVFNGQHYWEIGKRNYKLEKVKDEIKKSGFIIKKDFIAFDSPYHHFFILEK